MADPRLNPCSVLLTDLPTPLLLAVISWLPHTAKLRLRLVSRVLDMAVSSTFTSLYLDKGWGGTTRGGTFCERYSQLRQLAVSPYANLDGVGRLLTDCPGLFRHQLTRLVLHVGEPVASSPVIKDLLASMGPEQQLAVDLKHGPVRGAEHLHRSCTEVPGMARVTKLRLRSVLQLEEGAPAHLCCFSQLQGVTELIHLSFLYHTSAIQWVGLLTGLRRLGLQSVTCHQMAHEIPVACRALGQLTSLTMSQWLGRDAHPEHEELRGLTQLRELAIHGSPFTELFAPVLVDAAGELTNLQRLCLDVEIASSAPLSRLAQLQHLTVATRESQFGLIVPPTLTCLRSITLTLEFESLTCFELPDMDMDHLTSLRLRALASHPLVFAREALPAPARGIGGTHDNITRLVRWTALQQLWIEHGVLSGHNLEALATLPALSDLQLARVRVDPDCWALPHFPALRTMFCELYDMDVQQVQVLWTAFRRATHLRLTFTDLHHVDGPGIGAALSSFREAEEVSLRKGLEPAALTASLQGLASATRLTSLHLQGHCASLDFTLLKAFPQLERLTAVNRPPITDDAAREQLEMLRRQCAEAGLGAVKVEITSPGTRDVTLEEHVWAAPF